MMVTSGKAARPAPDRDESKGVPDRVRILLDERKLLEERVGRIDQMIFNFLAVVVTPFCALLGYALVNIDSKAKFAVLVAPYFTIVAAMIMAILYVHQYVGAYYGRHLAEKINESLAEDVPPLLLEKIDWTFWPGFGVQNGLLLIAAILVAETLLGAIPLINRFLLALPETGLVSPDRVTTLAASYWATLTCVLAIAVLACRRQFTVKVRELDQVVKDEDWRISLGAPEEAREQTADASEELTES